MLKRLFGGRNFYLKKYLIIVNFWAVLCSIFGFFFIFSRVNLTPEQANIYFFFFFIATIIVAGIVTLNYGGFRVLFGINIEHKNALAVNSFILEDHVDPNISDDNLKELFHQLKKEGESSFRNIIFYASLVAILAFIPLVILRVSVPNLMIVVIGDILAVIIVSLFTRFSSERFCSVFLRECREMMKSTNITYVETIKLITL